jgi:glutathione S-transferase
MAPPPQHTLKLYYFGTRARGEHIRQTLKAAGVPFDDVILDREQWCPLKAEMPLGQVPVLEVDGVKIGESKAIARFVGEEYGTGFQEIFF